jgi:5-bromo-4-chloroindolyl phosphate hydrolysis protein
MSPKKNSSKDNVELVADFLDIALQQYDAIEKFDNARFNRLYARLKAVEAELKSRPGDARNALAKLYQHNNVNVRLQAALATLALQPFESREVLRQVKDTKITPYSADAWGMLNSLDEGRYEPD